MRKKCISIRLLISLMLTAVVVLAGRGTHAAVIGGDWIFAKPILNSLVEAFQEDRHPKERLRVVCQDNWEVAEAFGRGQSETILSLGPLPLVMSTVIAKSSPGGNFVRWEKLEVGQIRVIAIVNAANTSSGLTFEQIQKLLSSKTGEGMTWNDLEGHGGLVTCYGEHEKSTSRQILRDRVMQFTSVEFPGERGVRSSGHYSFRDTFALCADAQEVIDEIARDLNGIGFITFTGQLSKEVRVLPLAEKVGDAFVTPKLEPVAQKDYPLCLPILLHVHPSASKTVQDFAQWASGPAGTEVLSQVSGYTQPGEMTVDRPATNNTARDESSARQRPLWYQDLFAVDVKGKWGYIDAKGKIVIEPVYEEVHCFGEGLAGVKLNGKYGYVDTSGKIVIPAQFRCAFLFREGLAWVDDGTNGGFIDKTGRIVLHAPDNTYCREFRCGLAMTMPIPPRFATSDWKRKIGFIDKTGKYAIEPRFDAAQEFSEDLAAVAIDSRWGFVDKAGMIVIQPLYEMAWYFQDGIASVQLAFKTRYIDKVGKPAIPKEYDDGHSFSEGLAGVTINGKWGFIDKTGAIVIEPQFDDVSSFFNGRAGVIVNKKFGYIDRTGKIVVEPQYDYGHFFLGELASVWFNPDTSNGAGRGYVNRSGQVVWKPRPKTVGDIRELQYESGNPPPPPPPAPQSTTTAPVH